jgi:hypothetical protein
MLLWSPYVIRSNVSIDAFAHFMEIFNGFEPQFSPEIVNDLMLLVREFGYDRLIASLAPQRDAPRRQEHAHGLLQELGKHVRGATFKVDLRFLRDSLSGIQRRMTAIREGTDGELEGILSELEKKVLK